MSANRPTKVLHVIHDLRFGGTERRMVAVLASLDRSRFEPLVCCIGGLGPLADDVRALGIEPVVLGRRSRRDFGGAVRLARLVRRERIQVVHGWLYLANLFARIGGRLGGAPVVVVAEGGAVTTMDRRKAQANARVDRALLRLTDAVIANSNAVADALRAQAIPESKLAVIHNGVAVHEPLAPERRQALRASVGARDREQLIGMVARLDPDFKDHATLLRAAAGLHARDVPLRVAIVGEGPSRASLEQLAASLGIGSIVTFAGYREDAEELLGAFDVSVLLSYVEGFSNVVLESMAWGTPLVVTDIPANAEALRAGVDGLVVPVGDVDATVAAIERLLADPDAARAHGASARERARQRFSLEAQGTATMGLYDRLLAEKRRR